MQNQICNSKFCYYNIATDISETDKQAIKNVPCTYCIDVKYCSQRCMEQDQINHRKVCSRNSDTYSTSTLSVNRKCLADYEMLALPGRKQELGRGSYGSVKLVKEKQSGKKYAMKIISKKTIFQYCSVENLKREIKIQKKLLHPNITKLHHYFEDKENVYLILEFAEKGSLFHFLRKKKRLSEKEAFVYFFQTCLGIDYLHKKAIIHRDLKPENLLLDEEGNIKLCDFGWSAEAFSNQKRTTFCGTIDYMSPEMIKNEPHDHTLDIWCLGILLYELVHGDAPFKGSNDHQKCSSIVNGQTIQYDSSISSNCKSLISSILKQKPKDRLSMSSIFNHPWMKQMEYTYNIQISSYVYKENSSMGQSNQPKYQAEKQNISPQSQIPKVKQQQFNDVKYNSEIKSDQYDPYLKKYNIDNNREINLYNKLEKKLDNNNYDNYNYGSKNNQYGQKSDYNKGYGQSNRNYDYLDDDNYRTRVSRVSQRNNQLDINSRGRQYGDKKEEEGFFNKLLGAFGCINRDNKDIPKDSNMIKQQKQYY